jgi:hypothetical protein
MQRNLLKKITCDCLYWYNERANVGSLAAAIWKQKGFALEEYNSVKGFKNEKRDGRIDLFFSYKTPNKRIDCILEAKMLWLYCNRIKSDNIGKKISIDLIAACKDAEDSLRGQNYYQGIGVVFVAPYWNKGFAAQDLLPKIEQYIPDCQPSFWAKYIHQGQDIKSSKGNICNAIYLVGKGIKSK